MSSKLILKGPLFSLLLTVLGCQGDYSTDPPIHLNLNMDFQKKYKAQRENAFFADRRAMRPLVEGTVAVGELKEDSHLYEGKVSGAFAKRLPMKMDHKLLQRGQERYGIYCSMCHGLAGDGNSILMTRNMVVPPPDYAEARIRNMPVGEIFNIVSKGVRNMPSYGAQIPAEDRWAIVAYVKALQLAAVSPVEHVPHDVAEQKGWKAQ